MSYLWTGNTYDHSPNPEFASFCGVFWAFPQSIEGFPHCKPLIVVDSKDLNGKYPMKLMIASGFDADNCYFPLAFAFTKEVSSDSWRWFLSGIKVTQRKELCLISSLDPDILAVINEPGSLWKEPWAYHRFCLDHLSSQFDDVFQSSRLKSLMKQAGLAIQQDEFDFHMETIEKENPETRRWLDKIPPHQWALAHDGGRSYGDMTMNIEKYICESLPSPGLPVTAVTLLLFDEIRMNFHQVLSDSRRRLNQGDMYTKHVIDELEEFRTASVTYVVMPLDNNEFKVTEPLQKDGWIVQLSKCTCTCGEFQKNKISCVHALTVCEKLKINPLQYVDNCYSLELLYRTYSAKFNPVPEVSAWPEVSGVPTLLPPAIPPPTHNKFPCLHTLAVCEKLKINPLQYVDNYCSLERLDRTYSAKFNPVPEVSGWPEASGVPTLFPPVIPPPPPPPTHVSGMSKRKTTPRTSQKKS
ncbi:unnamed protein product [Arabis nemorensis]|uniref:SWIM-type domain-containing protein n=1 Tax=Arabis nemorensis TaxID=586526 RepID=A0A565AYF4_9BRAS|nr:unnamed protein product [Arabis nemorensis]